MLNGLPVLSFDVDLLVGSPGSLGSATIFAIARYYNNTGNSYIYSAGAPYKTLSRRDGDRYYTWTGTAYLGDPIVADEFHYFSQVYYSDADASLRSGSSWQDAYLNGVNANINVNTATSPYNTSGGNITVGRWIDSGCCSFEGDLAELIIYDRALDDSERLLVEDYLAARIAGATVVPIPAAAWLFSLALVTLTKRRRRISESL